MRVCSGEGDKIGKEIGNLVIRALEVRKRDWVFILKALGAKELKVPRTLEILW